MQIIPAIDIRGAKVVRLLRGDYNSQTVYADDPVSVAKSWQEQGAGLLHIVDLDGAQTGKSKNKEIIGSICKEVSIPVEVGGGIRRIEDILSLFELRVARIVLGSLWTEDIGLLEEITGRFRRRIILSIDAQDGLVKVKGWKESIDREVVCIVREVVHLCIAGLIYTDISRDGTMQGPNIEEITKILQVSSLPLIVAGGISTIEDIKALKQLEPMGLKGIIIGRALYEKRLSLRECLSVA